MMNDWKYRTLDGHNMTFYMDKENVAKALDEAVKRNIALCNDEVKEIENALLEGGLERGSIKWKSFFIGFVGEKLIEKALGLNFCDMTFDKPVTNYAKPDIPLLDVGVKTVYKGDRIWACGKDLHEVPQILVKISYEPKRKDWILEDAVLCDASAFKPVNGLNYWNKRQDWTIDSDITHYLYRNRKKINIVKPLPFTVRA